MSGYVHSGINPMIKVEAYKHENKLLIANKYGNAKVGNLKESDVANVIESVGNLNELNTTDKSNIVAAVNELAAGGGGEEQFQKVYETELEEASGGIAITSEDIGGEYVDIVLYLSLEGDSNERTLEINFGSSDVDSVTSVLYSLPADAQMMHYMGFSVLSVGGLLHSSYFSQNSDRTIGNSASGFLNNGSDFDYVQPYPSNAIPCVSSISLTLSNQAEVPPVFPAYTYIAVYARRKVTEPVAAEPEPVQTDPSEFAH